MHLDLTAIVVLTLLSFGLYRAAKDVKRNINNPPTPPDLIQDQINTTAGYVVADAASESIGQASNPAIHHLIETILHHLHVG